MKKATYFDVEYANTKNKSICQIGIICEDYTCDKNFYSEENIYLNPDDGFDNNCIRIHGISPDKVNGEKSFPQIWDNIEKYFTNAVVIGHNIASADLDAIVKNLRRYNIPIPEFYYICTLNLARKYIPTFAVSDYSLSTLCKYFNINFESKHNASDDVSASYNLFKALVNTYNIDVDANICKYNPHDTAEFTNYVASPVVRKTISEFYGVIRGFSIDNEINNFEMEYISKWRKENLQYTNYVEFSSIIVVIDKILDDGKISMEEIMELQSVIKSYLDVVSTAPVTLATQILDGIMKGITVDGEVNELECRGLRQWLYDNIYLTGHYPFDKLLQIIENVLLDSVITKEESEYITATIHSLLNPVDYLKTQVNSVNGKNVCLSGNFSYGKKSDVEKYLVNYGAIIDVSLKKTTDILIIGDCECQAYSNGTYGTKVKKVIEYNSKGCSIQIIKEADIFKEIK